MDINFTLTHLAEFRSMLSTYNLSSALSMPYAKAAAVGSLITRKTFRPEICPASFVACL